MTTAEYLNGRKQYQRPQGMLWSVNGANTSIQTSTGLLIPDGIEHNANSGLSPSFLILTDDNRSPIDFSIDRIQQRKRMVNGRMRSFHIADKLNLSVSWDMIPSRSFIGDPDFNTTTGTANFSASNQKYTTDGGAGGNEILSWYEDHTEPFYVFLAYDKYPNVLKTATITAAIGNGTSTVYTANNKFSAGDLVVVNNMSTSQLNGAYTISAANATSFTVSSEYSGEVTQSGNATSRNTLAQYNEVVEMQIADFSYSVERRGGSTFDLWSVSVSLEEV